MPNERKFFIYGLLSLIIAISISGCDPHTQYGVRELQTSDKNSIVASIRYWGPGSSYDNSVSLDGGYTWDDNHYLGDRRGLQHKIEGDCDQDCIIEDPTDVSVLYRISKGKTLYLSSDNGITWQSILYIPAWKDFQKNYVLKIHSAYVPIDKGIRGPFDVITDPHTGNILVAMGYEGILLKTPSEEWEWIEVARYKKIHIPSRLAMLGQIEFHLWLIALSVALLSGLINLKSINDHKIKFWKVFLILFVIFIFSTLTNTHSFDYYYDTKVVIYNNLIIIFTSAAVCYLIFEKVKAENFNPFLNKIKSVVNFFAISTFFLYMVPLLMWSQGVQIKLSNAGILGLGISIIYIFLQVIFIKVYYHKKN
jgi:hypothetical protein